MNQKAREVVKVDSCPDGREVFRIAKKTAGEKRDVVRVSCLKDECGAMTVWMIERKSGKSIWKS